ncbi:uncharacterized protein LOC123694979 [Colias croceus]|uniref:uncharacterized protein LOC123694979 n=1 Tax=Colias crocea TaxID=72248 RepID=UPI001E2817B6|nr:uncharacterized protein LOC123694979 [Colias croceus]
MKRRGLKLVNLFFSKEKVTKNARKRVQSPVPPRNEEEVSYLLEHLESGVLNNDDDNEDDPDSICKNTPESISQNITDNLILPTTSITQQYEVSQNVLIEDVYHLPFAENTCSSVIEDDETTHDIMTNNEPAVEENNMFPNLSIKSIIDLVLDSPNTTFNIPSPFVLTSKKF